MKITRGKRWGIGRMVVAAALLALGTAIQAAELIQTPSKTVLRSLTDWEQTLSLQVFRNGTWSTPPMRDRVINVDFTDSDFCSDAAYRTEDSVRGVDEVSLSHLCDGGRFTSFDFLFIADTQENHSANDITAKYIASMIDENPGLRFVVTGGDIVQGGTEEEWKAYRTAAQQYTARLPIVPVLGNHEYMGSPGISLFEKVYATLETARGYYMISHPLANLIVLNSNVNELSDREKGAQDLWLQESLIATKDSGKKTIVTFHHAPYTTGFGVLYMPWNPNYIKKHWVPLFEQHGVDLVLTGHEHLFERIIRNNVTYLVAGPAAGKLSPRRPFAQQGSVICLPNKRTVTKVSVTEEGISLLTLEVGSGAVLDRVSID